MRITRMRALVALGAVLVLALATGGALAVGKNARTPAAAAADEGHLRLPASERRLSAVSSASACRARSRQCPGMSEDRGPARARRARKAERPGHGADEAR